MYQGFKYYYKKGLKNSFKTFKKAKNSFKFLMFVIIQLITLPLIFLSPITCNARINLSKQIKEDRKISVVKAFDTRNIGQVYWKIILAVLLELLVWVAGLAAISLVTLPVIMIAQTLGVAVYVTIVAIIIAVIYTILILLYAIPVVYVISTKPEYSYAEAVYTGMRMLKKKGKFAIIFNEILSMIWLIPVGIIYSYYFKINSLLTPLGVIVFGVGICVITLFMIFFYLPFVMNTNIVTLYCLFEDLIKEEGPITFKGFKVKNIKYLEEPKYKNKYLEKLFEVQNLDIDSVKGIQLEENKNNDVQLSKKEIKKLEKANKKAEKEKLALEKKLAKEEKKEQIKEEIVKEVVEEKIVENIVEDKNKVEEVIKNNEEEIVKEITEEVVEENEVVEEEITENNEEVIENNEEEIVDEITEEVEEENEVFEEEITEDNEEVVENNEEEIVDEITEEVEEENEVFEEEIIEDNEEVIENYEEEIVDELTEEVEEENEVFEEEITEDNEEVIENYEEEIVDELTEEVVEENEVFEEEITEDNEEVIENYEEEIVDELTEEVVEENEVFEEEITEDNEEVIEEIDEANLTDDELLEKWIREEEELAKKLASEKENNVDDEKVGE